MRSRFRPLRMPHLAPTMALSFLHQTGDDIRR
jgi:hypothetical protein